MKKEELKKSRQYHKLKDKSRAFISVPLTWCVRFDLSPTELFLFCYIRYYTENYTRQAYTGSVKGLCVIANCSLPTARKALETLCQKGFIRKIDVSRDNSAGRSVDWVSYESMISSEYPPNSAEIEELLERSLVRTRAVNK